MGCRFLNSFVRAGLCINVGSIAVPLFLRLLGWDSGIKDILGDGLLLNSRVILALMYASTALPFTIFLFSSYFEILPSDFEEAASIDGAGYFRTMFSVMLPMAAPSIIIVILFNFLLF